MAVPERRFSIVLCESRMVYHLIVDSDLNCGTFIIWNVRMLDRSNAIVRLPALVQVEVYVH